MKRTIHQKIAAWYAANGRRDLPWRNSDNSYHIYLSEIMLQQTQVKTVLERFYFPFLGRFPTLKSLGDAPLDDVLKMWEGLGYYTRAKNLHRTAQQTQGTLPFSVEELLRLPGIGINTAHAIAAFAFHQPLPVMEANVKRILCRLHCLEKPSSKLLWYYAEELLDRKNPYDYNQAMMDIGSMVCLPKNPLCDSCPLETICEGKEKPERYPIKKRRIVPTREQDIIIYSYDDRIALKQRRERFLHGLWGFYVAGERPCGAEYLGEVAHQYTHFKLKCRVYHYPENRPEQEHYFSLETIKTLAISKVDEKIIKLLLQSEKNY
jgi:A/G-specific adenine glycosylase